MWIFLMLLLVRVLANKECHRRDDVSRDCNKPCYNETDCVSHRKRCLCDGPCGKSCINPGITCSKLPLTIPNGWVEQHGFNRFGGVVEYHCDERYTLIGNVARVCQGNEAWSGEEPQCVTNREDGDVIQREISNCPEPPNVLRAVHNGRAGKKLYIFGSTVEYQCKNGFVPTEEVRSVPRAWCRGDGWVGPQLTCTIVCSEPPYVRNAEHAGALGQEHYSTGSELFYVCLVGFIDAGHPRAICSDRGEWTGLSLKCTIIRCDYPDEIINGRRVGYNFTYSNEITYRCDSGYELNGQQSRVCLATGQWSESTPDCNPIQCVELHAPLYGSMIGFGRNFGAEIRFECNDGFMLKGSSTRTCQADKLWSGTVCSCGEIDCGWPSPIWNGKIIGDMTTIGATLHFNCSVYSNFAGPSLTTQCMPNGQWSHPSPICWGECVIQHIPNATLLNDHGEGNWVRHDTIINFQCMHGMIRNNYEKVRCNNGTWTYTPMCIPAQCNNPPPLVYNGIRVYFGKGHGNRAKYICFPGYKLEYVDNALFPYLVCQYGKWHGGHPVCVNKYCPNPGSLKHGLIYKKGVGNSRFKFKPYIISIEHGHRIVFECDDYYHLNGANGSTCVDGHWQPSPKLTKCVKTMHPKFERLWRPLEEINYVYT